MALFYTLGVILFFVASIYVLVEFPMIAFVAICTTTLIYAVKTLYETFLEQEIKK